MVKEVVLRVVQIPIYKGKVIELDNLLNFKVEHYTNVYVQRDELGLAARGGEKVFQEMQKDHEITRKNRVLLENPLVRNVVTKENLLVYSLESIVKHFHQLH